MFYGFFLWVSNKLDTNLGTLAKDVKGESAELKKGRVGEDVYSILPGWKRKEKGQNHRAQ